MSKRVNGEPQMVGVCTEKVVRSSCVVCRVLPCTKLLFL